MTLPLPASLSKAQVFFFFYFISKPQCLGSETPASWGPKRLVETPTSWKGVLTWWLVGGAGLSYPFSCSRLNYTGLGQSGLTQFKASLDNLARLCLKK